MKNNIKLILACVIYFLLFSLNNHGFSQAMDVESIAYEEVLSIQTGPKALPGTFHLIRINNTESKEFYGLSQILTTDEINSIAIFAETQRLENSSRYIIISPYLKLFILPKTIIESSNFQPNPNLFID